jgi:site-specific DNA recombinase
MSSPLHALCKTAVTGGIRLIDSYTESVIDKAEFEPRIAGLKLRVSQLQDRHQAALEMAESERDLALVISRLEDFSAKVTASLDNLDRLGMQDTGHHSRRGTPD